MMFTRSMVIFLILSCLASVAGATGIDKETYPISSAEEWREGFTKLLEQDGIFLDEPFTVGELPEKQYSSDWKIWETWLNDGCWYVHQILNGSDDLVSILIRAETKKDQNDLQNNDKIQKAAIQAMYPTMPEQEVECIFKELQDNLMAQRKRLEINPYVALRLEGTYQLGAIQFRIEETLMQITKI